ncbi:MAG TPA: acetyl-CoA C-acetyltransferase [Firmicutes bacterium]|nr:acetyl-CoA C-acetyltransferase [Bacillota bacterium]
MTDTVFIVGAKRTPIGRFLGALQDIPATTLGTIAGKAALEASGLKPEDVEQVIMGNVCSTGLGQNPARQVQIGMGVPSDRNAFLVGMVCGSGLQSANLGYIAIKAGMADAIVAGGMESMSLAPYYLPKARTGYRLGHGELMDSMVYDGLWDPYSNFHMGNTGELVAEKYSISKEEQDEYAYNSHRKAIEAIDAGRFEEEIVPVPIPQRKGDPVLFKVDEGPRRDTTIEALAKLRPVFKKDGTVTAGNAPGTNDGGAAVVLASEKVVKEKGLKPLAKILATGIGGLDPEWVMLTPIPTCQKIFAQGYTKDDFDLYEFNEAFSVQQIAVRRELGIDESKINVNGGAVALGHPIGCSGARILVTLIHALKQRNLKKGVAALCLGGGNGVGMAIELL